MNELYPIQDIRKMFPALCRMHNGNKAVYLDGPGGSQVVATAITAMTNYMRRGVANTHGKFPSSEETEELISAAKTALGDFFVCSPDEIAFGANATSNMFAVSRALSRSWNPGDEIVVSEMDHHSHIDTWILAARDRGVTIRSLPVNPETLMLNLDALDSLITTKTRLVAVGYASNAIGTINDVSRISQRCRETGALLSLDAVHIAPHMAIDMSSIDADFLFCSAYKFFGGHIGIVAIRKNVFDALETCRLHPAPSTPPGKLETGTQSHEAIASIVPAIDFIAGLGNGSTRRERLVSGFELIDRHENALAEIVREGLANIPGLTLYQSAGPKTATIAFTLEGRQPGDVCHELCDKYSIFAADGDYYAETLAHKLGVDRIGGWIRVGFAPYNTGEEAELLVRSVREIATASYTTSGMFIAYNQAFEAK